MIIVQTPLRVSLFGGGTDFPSFFLEDGGCVLTTAINKYIFVIIKKRYDDMIRISYTRTEIVDHIDEINHELIREVLRKTGLSQGVEIITMGDIPAGSGLGSSSTVTVGALHAVYQYQKKSVPVEQLAREACEIEIDRLGKPIGFQDQFIAAYGGLRFFEFTPGNQVKTQDMSLEDGVLNRLDERLLLFFSGTTRKAETILSEQKENIQAKKKVLNRMKQLAYNARDALCAGQLDDIGYLLHESWQLKKQLASGITNQTLEDAYEAALGAGATGGKVAGAGGGGYLIVYTPPSRRDDVRRALCPLQELPFHLEKDGSKVLFNYQY